MLPQLRDAGLFGPVMVMEREHGEIWAVLDALEAAITQGSARPDVTGDPAALTTLLANHNAKEEPIVHSVITGLGDPTEPAARAST